MSPWTWGWIGWGAWFAIEEGWALKTIGLKGTLSYLVWTAFAIHRRGTAVRPVTPFIRLRRFALLAVVAWIAAHFLTGGVF